MTSRSLAFGSSSDEYVEVVRSSDSIINSKTAGIRRNLESGYSVWKTLYETVKSASMQKSVKDLFLEMACRE
jgi:hypothetical protein